MNKIYMLTKPDCPQCQALKMFLKMALRDKYGPDIIQVDQIGQASEFKTWVDKFNILSLPALICDDDILRKCNPMPTTVFLEKHLGKR